MDRAKFTAISHRGIAHCNPVSAAKIDQLIDLLDLPPTAAAIDFGCGKAELLLRLIARYGVKATGIDRSAPMLAEARVQAAARDPGRLLTLHETDAAAFPVGPGSLDLAVCIGATDIFGGLRPTLTRLKAMVRPGGYVLVGEGFWRKDPEPEYLAAMGAAADEFADHAANIAAGVQVGLVPYYSAVSSDDDWDRYEWLHCRAVELYAAQHPEDPDTPALLARIRAWRDLYLRWGRETLGFAIDLFRA